MTPDIESIPQEFLDEHGNLRHPIEDDVPELARQFVEHLEVQRLENQENRAVEEARGL